MAAGCKVNRMVVHPLGPTTISLGKIYLILAYFQEIRMTMSGMLSKLVESTCNMHGGD